jgi:hypothetical protein
MGTKISQPTVETITAELFVVKIGNKQMTISVFNQLYCEDCWDEEWNLVYPIWGKINRDGEYVIFQKGNDLRKCEMPKKWGKLNFSRQLIYFMQEHFSRIIESIPEEYLKTVTDLPEEKTRPFRTLKSIAAGYRNISAITKTELVEAADAIDVVFKN